MRNSSTLRSVAVMYLAGLTWCAVLLGFILASLEPMSGLYGALGIEHPLIQAIGTLVVAMTLASVVAGALWYGLRQGTTTIESEVAARA